MSWYEDETVTVLHGDCIETLRSLPDCSVDSVVTDPPYGLEFMGKDWDAPWRKGDDINADAGMAATGYTDGGNRLPRPTFTGSTNPKCHDCGGTRRGRRDGTAKVKVCICEDGGRFPNVRAAEMLAFQQWCELWVAECLRVLKPGGHLLAFGGTRTWHRLAVAVEDAGFEVRDSIAWLHGQGFPKGKQQLKPAFEPVVVARKPLVGTVAGNVLACRTGALNIDGCRVAHSEPAGKPSSGMHGRSAGIMGEAIERHRETTAASTAGRWPANVVLDGTQADALDTQSGTLKSGANPTRRGSDKFRDAYGDFKGQTECTPARGADEGGASRFFPTFRYQAKAPTSERPKVDGIAHPTVKPLELMRWLVRLVTPPGGTVLEPFAGSGTTVEAAMLEGFRVTAIEREADYLPLILARINRVGVTPPPPEPEPDLLDLIEGDVA